MSKSQRTEKRSFECVYTASEVESNELHLLALL